MANSIEEFYAFMEDNYKDGTLHDDDSTVNPLTLINLGSFEDLEGRSNCITCQDLVCKSARDGKMLSQQELIFESCSEGLWIQSSDKEIGDYYQLRGIRDSVRAYEAGRKFDESRISLSLLYKWIDCCQESHGTCCLSSELPLPSHKIYLVDVKEKCLVLISAEIRYIALSYVWGHSATTKTTNSNLALLKKPGSISDDVIDIVIPKTIRDALRLVSLLGERYLWVDTFCIIQDDQDTKQLHINSMASIYANAYLTIIAANGYDANSGLGGIGGGAEARNVACDTIRLHSGKEIIFSRVDASHPDNTIWISRGWTFQEAYFSRRILIFNGLVSWFCRRAIWDEHVNSPTEDAAYAITGAPSSYKDKFVGQSPIWPDIDLWGELVMEFNKRKLTYDKDVVDALSGATSVFNSVFNGGILWGIPVMFFDFCILWKPRAALRRRGDCIGSPLDNALPSWSWVGWEGHIVLLGSTPIWVNPPESDHQIAEVQPLVHWHKSKSPSTSSFPVKNLYHSLQRAYQEFENLPKGWSRKIFAQGTPYYSHDTVPSVCFRYLPPLANEDITSLPDNQSRYLLFRAQRVRLLLGQTIVGMRQNSKCCSASLIDIEGNWAGTMWLSTSMTGRPPVGEPCELIALSSGKAMNSSDYVAGLAEWRIPERPRDSEFYQFYNVMWIEWEKGIAYRKAVGTVYKDVWERQIRDDIDVILG